MPGDLTLDTSDAARTKHVLGVSLGSSERDFDVTMDIGGQPVRIQRMGTDSDAERFAELLREYDGKVDAFGFGGGDVYVWSAGRRYTWRRELRLVQAAQQTPVLDGSGLKNTIERETIRRLHDEGTIDFRQAKTLQVCAVDRFGMAEALAEIGGPVVYGDLIFALGLPLPVRRLGTIALLARLMLPLMTRCPQQWFYPTGKKQKEIVPRHGRWFAWADVICGDFHFIRRSMPPDLEDKAIVTNTTTAKDVELLRERGARLLVTTTPELEGRSPGTNIMDALVVALCGKQPEGMTPDDYMQVLGDMGWRPRVEYLTEEAA